MKKQWYEISLNNNEEGFKPYSEVVARVKSKGLAYIVYQQIKITYAKTDYTVKIN